MSKFDGIFLTNKDEYWHLRHSKRNLVTWLLTLVLYCGPLLIGEWFRSSSSLQCTHLPSSLLPSLHTHVFNYSKGWLTLHLKYWMTFSNTSLSSSSLSKINAFIVYLKYFNYFLLILYHSFFTAYSSKSC